MGSLPFAVAKARGLHAVSEVSWPTGASAAAMRATANDAACLGSAAQDTISDSQQRNKLATHLVKDHGCRQTRAHKLRPHSHVQALFKPCSARSCTHEPGFAHHTRFAHCQTANLVMLRQNRSSSHTKCQRHVECTAEGTRLALDTPELYDA